MKVRYKGGHHATVWCPGCEVAHMFTVVNEQGERPHNGLVWEWDRDVETPTFEPSMLVRGGPKPEVVCHSFLRNGMWMFLNDSTHSLAGENVPMVDLPWHLANN